MNNAHLSPQKIRVNRDQGVMRVEWRSGAVSELSLEWLRANCPCASCRAARGEGGVSQDPLALHTGPPISTTVAGVELVGGYAIRILWDDGHDTGIYAFSWLYELHDASDGEAEGDA